MSTIAIFDLDETLIHQKSLLAVAERYYTTYRAQQDWDLLLSDIKHHQAKGYSRKFLNAYFFQHFKSIAVQDMQQCIKQWFTRMLSSNHFWHTPVIEQLRKHQSKHDIVLVVSGSFYEAVKPITDYLGIEHIICNKLTIEQGHYTGELDQGPIIGDSKVHAICRYLKIQGIDGTVSHAYGDHPSDIPMLSLAQTPVAVGNDPELMSWAENRCWSQINS